MATLATLAVKLIGDTAGFSESMAGAAGQTKQFADKFEGKAKRIGGLGSIMSGAMSWVTGNVIMKGIDAVASSFGSLTSGMKSVAILVLMQDTARTLTDAEIEQAVDALAGVARREFGATLRSQDSR